MFNGLAFHCLWFFVKNANALAFIAFAFFGALKIPPAALTWAPTFFKLIYPCNRDYNFNKWYHNIHSFF